MDFIPRDPSCCSFHTPDSFLPPWYLTLKMTAPLVLALNAENVVITFVEAVCLE